MEIGKYIFIIFTVFVAVFRCSVILCNCFLNFCIVIECRRTMKAEEVTNTLQITTVVGVGQTAIGMILNHRKPNIGTPGVILEDMSHHHRGTLREVEKAIKMITARDQIG